MNREIAFEVYQYAYANKIINKNFIELIRYMKNNHIVLDCAQTLISGRVFIDLKIGDILMSEKGTQIYLKGFHTYGQEMDFMPAGMTCVIIIDMSDEELCSGERLYFTNQNTK